MQKNNHPVWTNVSEVVHEAMTAYLDDHDLTISEFVRNCIMSRLLDERYLGQEQLELIVL